MLAIRRPKTTQLGRRTCSVGMDPMRLQRDLTAGAAIVMVSINQSRTARRRTMDTPSTKLRRYDQPPQRTLRGGEKTSRKASSRNVPADDVCLVAFMMTQATRKFESRTMTIFGRTTVCLSFSFAGTTNQVFPLHLFLPRSQQPPQPKLATKEATYFQHIKLILKWKWKI